MIKTYQNRRYRLGGTGPWITVRQRFMDQPATAETQLDNLLALWAETDLPLTEVARAMDLLR